MSVKAKLTIYNTILMTVMVSLVLFFMVSISGSVINISAQSELKSVVHDNVDEIEYKNGSLDFEDVEFYEDQVSTLIYSQKGELLAGSSRYEFMEPLIHGQVISVYQNEVEYLIYDVLHESKRGDNVYVRGIISTSAVSDTLNIILILAIIMLPIFILLSALGSYILCKKSLKPLHAMIETAEKISEEDDLSLRINLKKGKDEVSRLAMTFDKMMEKLESLVKTEKRFSSDISHELRTPVSVILAECEVAEDSNEEDMNQAIKGVKYQAEKIKDLITQLLNLVRLENGVQKPELEEMDLSDLVNVVCKEQQLVLPEGLTLESKVEEGIVYELDYSMISRVLDNLISNSIKYIGEGSKIKVELKRVDKRISMAVTDDGMGIPLAEQVHIFERFYCVDKARTDEKSTGLGLSMVKQLVEINGGVVQVRSQVGIGSTFEVLFEKE